MLQILQGAGILKTTDTARQTRSVLQKAAEDHANAATPDGRVVQLMYFEGLEEPWEYCEPRAYLRYLSTLNDSYGEIMSQYSNGSTLHVIMYLDEIVPGNPFRQDQGRKIMGVYWACLEWPGWLLARSGFWPVLGIMKSKTIHDKLPGGVSAFWKHIVRLFKDDIHVQVVYKEERIPFTLKYAGTMADEAALKDANNFKGASGIKPCMDCKGLINTTDDSLLPPGTWSLNATSLKDRARNTNADVWRAADSLHQLACDGQAYKERGKELGITYNHRGILWDLSLRHIHKPIDSYIRDWMHIWVSGGACNSQIFGLKGALKDNGIPISIVRTYSLEVILPKQYGTVSAAWLDDNRFSDNDFSSFASYQLTLVPIIGAFLEDCVKPHNIMMQHIACFLLLVQILGLLLSGADYAVQHIPLLAMLIVEHHKLYVQLYPHLIKPKFHHILHLPELYMRLQKVILCFVAISCSGIFFMFMVWTGSEARGSLSWFFVLLHQLR